MTEPKKHPIYLATNHRPLAVLSDHHFTDPIPITCKWCGSKEIKKYGVRKDVQEYICLKCNRKFIEKDAPFKKQTPSLQIGASLEMFYDGLSFNDIARRLERDYQNKVAESTIYRWIMHYSQKAIEYFDPLKPKVSDTLVVDETVLRIEGKNLWFWDVIDEDTRFLIASHLSCARTTWVVAKLMEKVKLKIGKVDISVRRSHRVNAH
jgi:putative transposase